MVFTVGVSYETSRMIEYNVMCALKVIVVVIRELFVEKWPFRDNKTYFSNTITERK